MLATNNKVDPGSKYERQAQRSARAKHGGLRWRSVADLYHAYFTGLILTVVTRRGTAMPRNSCSGCFAASSRNASCRAGKARSEPSAAGGRRRAVSLSLQLDRRRPCRIHVRDRSQGLDPLSAAALDLARHRDLRRARRSVARDAARMARQQRRGARQSQTRLRLHQAERRRPGRARRLLLRIRSSARARSAAGVRAPSRSAVVRSRQLRRRCRSRAGRSRGWKKPIATTRWNMCRPPRP